MEEPTIVNEFDDSITKREISELIGRIRNLGLGKIDEFWFRNGFVFQDKGSNRAMPKKAIKDFIESDDKAEELLGMLFAETHLEDLRKQLADMEREAA
ncbi:MAG: hypothetical protein KGH61_02815 [Candidatus Micrarchaeota archaeon]|nr:hypothetical protein [Candidatus Micrarchaeota archaeon]MDE1847856.1 hypothetical protein [Candidatus Micrarchaeota archaeon]MDE1864183.1 hypothetical protein [Candidatus Micrarchaeota archaeon]